MPADGADRAPLRLGAPFENVDAESFAREVETEYGALHLLKTTPPAGLRFYSAASGHPYVPDRATAAVEVAKATCGVRMIDRRVELDMSGVPTGAVGRRERDQSGRCTCASPWRRRAAAILYNDHVPRVV